MVTLIMLFVVFASTSVVIAEITPALELERNSSGYSGGGTDRTRGWEFTVTEDLSIAGLGIFDLDDDGLYLSHEIGMWHDGELISSATIPAGTDTLLVDDFRYVEIDPFWLEDGETYVIGNKTFGDPFVGASNDDMISMLPFITYERTMISEDGSGFSLPTLEIDSFYRIGPNFLIIPEPTTLAMLVAGLMLIRQRRNGPKSQ